VPLAAILDLCRDAHGPDVHELDGTRSTQDLACPLEVFARSLAQDLGLDEVGH
jgi:hypothetical protein